MGHADLYYDEEPGPDSARHAEDGAAGVEGPGSARGGALSARGTPRGSARAEDDGEGAEAAAEAAEYEGLGPFEEPAGGSSAEAAAAAAAAAAGSGEEPV